jgi:hypothetical protein
MKQNATKDFSPMASLVNVFSLRFDRFISTRSVRHSCTVDILLAL